MDCISCGAEEGLRNYSGSILCAACAMKYGETENPEDFDNPHAGSTADPESDDYEPFAPEHISGHFFPDDEEDDGYDDSDY